MDTNPVLTIEASKTEILKWFEFDDIPTEAQFRATWNSFWHKSESLPMSSITGLTGRFNQTVTKTAFDNHVGDAEAHNLILAKRDASNLSPGHINAWKIALGVGEGGDVDLSNYYTMQEVDDLLENVTVDSTIFSLSVSQDGNIINIPFSQKVTLDYLHNISNVMSFDNFQLTKGSNAAGSVRSNISELQDDINALTSVEASAGFTLSFRVVLQVGKSFATAELKITEQ